MIRAEEAASLYQSLTANNIQVWLTGGWGIDALLEEKTRPHKDLDIIVLVDDVARATADVKADRLEIDHGRPIREIIG